MVHERLDKTAQTVAAHFRNRSIGVVDAHAGGMTLDIMESQNSIGPDTEMPVAKSTYRTARQILGGRALPGVSEDEIVARTMELDEFHYYGSLTEIDLVREGLAKVGNFIFF